MARDVSPSRTDFGSLEQAVVSWIGEQYRQPYCNCQQIRWSSWAPLAKKFFQTRLKQDSWSYEGLVLFFLNWSTTPGCRGWYELQILLNDLCDGTRILELEAFAERLWSLAGTCNLKRHTAFWTTLRHHLCYQIPLATRNPWNPDIEFLMRYDNMMTESPAQHEIKFE